MAAFRILPARLSRRCLRQRIWPDGVARFQRSDRTLGGQVRYYSSGSEGGTLATSATPNSFWGARGTVSRWGVPSRFIGVPFTTVSDSPAGPAASRLANVRQEATIQVGHSFVATECQLVGMPRLVEGHPPFSVHCHSN